MKIFQFLKDVFKRVLGSKNVTNSDTTSSFSQTRDIFAAQSRDIKYAQIPQNNMLASALSGPAGRTQSNFQPTSERTAVCPYCHGKRL